MNNLKVFLTTVVLLISTSALAGRVTAVPVEVNFEEGSAAGNQLTARDSDSPNVFIGCGTRNFDDGVGGIFRFGFCQAEDAEGDSVTCFTQNPQLVDAMAANNSYAFILFSFRDDGFGGFECLSAGFSTQSFYLPSEKVKDK